MCICIFAPFFLPEMTQLVEMGYEDLPMYI